MNCYTQCTPTYPPNIVGYHLVLREMLRWLPMIGLNQLYLVLPAHCKGDMDPSTNLQGPLLTHPVCLLSRTPFKNNPTDCTFHKHSVKSKEAAWILLTRGRSSRSNTQKQHRAKIKHVRLKQSGRVFSAPRFVQPSSVTNTHPGRGAKGPSGMVHKEPA